MTDQDRQYVIRSELRYRAAFWQKRMLRVLWTKLGTDMLDIVEEKSVDFVCLGECVKLGFDAIGLGVLTALETLIAQVHNTAGAYTIHSDAMSVEARK